MLENELWWKSFAFFGGFSSISSKSEIYEIFLERTWKESGLVIVSSHFRDLFCVL